MRMSEGLTAIDLFCGAGGLTAALERAGFQTISSLDHDRDCVRTLRATQERGVTIEGRERTYLTGTKLLHADARDVTAKDLRPGNFEDGWRPDLLAGGPPCQPFSSAGRQTALDDPRGVLFREFVRLADELQPRFILFENVAGLVTAKCPNGHPGGVLNLIQRSFEEIGYACRCDLLNAADFGAAQRRVRLFMLASRNNPLPQFPPATHARDGGSLNRWVSLGTFLKQLPAPEPSDIVRPTGVRANLVEALLPGTGLKSGGIIEANRPGGHWGYRQDSFMADLALPARTIRAASTPDWVRVPGTSVRRLTWRECAALQGFPSNWAFEGSTASRFRQIGNAVQGQVGTALGFQLAKAAESPQAIHVQSAPWPTSFDRRVRYTQMEQVVNGEHRLAAKRALEARAVAGDGRSEPAEVVRQRA